MPPLLLRMHAHDNVAIVANDGGLPAGAVVGEPFALALVDKLPQGHKVALRPIGQGEAVVRYGVTLGTALQAIPAGGWVHERLLSLPAARSLQGLPMASRPAPRRRRWRASRSRAIATPTARWARATCWPSPRRCSASRAWWRTPPRASAPSCCRCTRTSTASSRWSTATAAVWPSTPRARRFPSARCATSAATPTSATR